MTTAPRKRVPATAPRPQDHKPKKSAAARQAEADGVAIIEQCGVELRIDMGNLPIKALMRLDGLNDDLTSMGEVEKRRSELMAFMELLGPEQWAALLDKNPGTRDFAEF